MDNNIVNIFKHETHVPKSSTRGSTFLMAMISLAITAITSVQIFNTVEQAKIMFKNLEIAREADNLDLVLEGTLASKQSCLETFKNIPSASFSALASRTASYTTNLSSINLGNGQNITTDTPFGGLQLSQATLTLNQNNANFLSVNNPLRVTSDGNVTDAYYFKGNLQITFTKDIPSSYTSMAQTNVVLDKEIIFETDDTFNLVNCYYQSETSDLSSLCSNMGGRFQNDSCLFRSSVSNQNILFASPYNSNNNLCLKNRENLSVANQNGLSELCQRLYLPGCLAYQAVYRKNQTQRVFHDKVKGIASFDSFTDFQYASNGDLSPDAFSGPMADACERTEITINYTCLGTPSYGEVFNYPSNSFFGDHQTTTIFEYTRFKIRGRRVCAGIGAAEVCVWVPDCTDDGSDTRTCRMTYPGASCW